MYVCVYEVKQAVIKVFLTAHQNPTNVSPKKNQQDLYQLNTTPQRTEQDGTSLLVYTNRATTQPGEN